MCGIFALIHGRDGADTPRLDFEKGLSLLSHRGPDSTGVAPIGSEDRVRGFLGHKRLSIIDLEGGKQPMVDDQSGLVLTYNGEIYNFKQLRADLVKDGYHFADQSDTEVILKAYHRWGADCVRRFRGMFAFAIWDPRKKELFVARDHFGKKPIFYVQRGSSLYVASEIKALLSLPELDFSLDYSVVRNYLVYRYVPGPDTLIKEIKKLPPGSTMRWREGRCDIHCFHSPAEADAAEIPVEGPDLVERFWDHLDEAVELRMQSDVPFGAFLSGGIDSSAVVALMSRHNQKRVKTFSVGFAEASYSELAYAKTVSDYFSTDHHELMVSHKDLIELLPDMIRYRDAPVSEPSDIPIYLLAKEAGRSVKMVLTGEGSDEVLGGYPKHVYERYGETYRSLPGIIRSGLIAPLVVSLPYRYRRAKTAIRNFNLDDFDERMPSWFGAMGLSDASKLLVLGEQRALPRLQRSVHAGFLRSVLLFDQMSWLPDNLLERGDRMTMAASIEARMPFMDVKLAAFASSLPDKYRVRGRTTKWILREAMKDVLPRSILERPKVGFRIPVNEWFQTSMKAQLMDSLFGPDSRSSCLYDAIELKRIVDDHMRGRQNHEKLLWTVLNLELWMRAYSSRVSM